MLFTQIILSEITTGIQLHESMEQNIRGSGGFMSQLWSA